MTRTRSFILLLASVALGAGAVVPTAQGGGAPGTISVLATNAIVGPLTGIVDEYTRQTGRQVKVEFDTSPNINRRFAAGTITGVDVLIAADGTVDQAVENGKAIADTRVTVGRVGVGVAIRRGAVRPDIATVDALKASLLEADAVVYTQGASGVYVAQLLQKLGLVDALGQRAVRVASGSAMIERVQASRGNEIGMTQVSEIRRAEEESGGAVVLVGPLPAAAQNYTVFDAVVMGAAASPDAARAFVRALAAPAARKLLTANGWEF